MLAHQQANFARLKGEDLLFDTAGEIPREDKQGDKQQHGCDQDIHHLADGNGIEIAGEIAHGDDAHHLSGIVENRRFAAQRNPQTAFTDSGDIFALQHFSVVAADQGGPHTIFKG
ncbi:hypothetical protein D3C78_1044660 [compost metagenome]